MLAHVLVKVTFPLPSLSATITATNKSNYSKTADLVLSLIKKKSLPEWRPRKIIPQHYTSKTHPADFPLSSLSRLPPPKKENHMLRSLFLISWPLACKLLKEEKKTCILKRSFCTKLFYYVYLCKWHVSLFKKVSLAPPLVALWSVFPACSMHDEQRQTGLMIGFYTDLYERGSREVSLLFSDSPSKFKMKRCWVAQGFYSRSSGSLSLLTNSGCLLIRLTVYF